MIKYSIDSKKGIFINKNKYIREIKLFTSPKSEIKREDFALGMTIIGVNKRHEVHAHVENKEIIVVYEGIGEAIIDGNIVSIEKDDIIEIEKNESHGFINTGNKELKLLWIYSPPGVADEKFFVSN